MHGIELNNNEALELDTTIDRNFIEEEQRLKRKADDSEHKEIWGTRGGVYKKYVWKYFYKKWKGTWKKEPNRESWIRNWPTKFIESPPDIRKSKIKTIIKYHYFEKDLDNLEEKNYLL